MKCLDDDISTRCVKLLLLPVMRFCLRHSLKFQEIIEASKSSLVQAAEQELERLGERVTINRLSIMTGIHRVDVQRLVGGEDKAVASSASNIINRVISRWQVDDRFRNADGTPRVLTFDGKGGEFAELLRSVSSDPNPYSVLVELERIGGVELTPDGVRLRTREYITNSDVGQSFQHLAQDSDDLISAVEENVFRQQDEPNLHLRTEYDNIPSTHVSGIRHWLLSEGSAFHRRVRDYLSVFDRDVNKELADDSLAVRISVGSYSRAEINSTARLATQPSIKKKTIHKGHCEG